MNGNYGSHNKLLTSLTATLL